MALHSTCTSSLPRPSSSRSTPSSSGSSRAGLPRGPRATATARYRAEPCSTAAERERLVTVLCNYCVGETAALEGAGGLIQHRAQPPRPRSSSPPRRWTRAATSRCCCSACASSESRTPRKRSRGARAAACSSSSGACSSWSRARLGGGAVRAERDPRGDGVRGVPRARRSADPRTREVLRGDREGRAPAHRLRRERARATPARGPVRPSAPRARDARSSTRWCCAPSRRRCTRSAPRARSRRPRPQLPRGGGAPGLHVRRATRCRRRRRSEARRRAAASCSTIAASTRSRRSTAGTTGAGRARRRARAQRGALPGLQGRGPLHPRAARPATASTAWRA